MPPDLNATDLALADLIPTDLAPPDLLLPQLILPQNRAQKDSWPYFIFLMNLSPQKRRLYMETKPCSNTEVALIYIYTLTRMTAEIAPYHYGQKWYSRNFATPLWIKNGILEVLLYHCGEKYIYI